MSLDPGGVFLIISGLIDLVCNILKGLLSLADKLNIPTDAINVIGQITKYGCWIVGADFMALFFGVVIAMYSIKFSIGVIEWLWKMLPLT